jgi:hypothetical protein
MKSIPKAPLLAGAAVLAVLFMTKVFGVVLSLDRPEALVAAIFFVLVMVIAACWALLTNLPPVCANRACGPRDYTVIGTARDVGIPGYEPLLQCRCGHRYLRRANRFFAVNKRNYLEKYMVKANWYSRWTPDPS